ncbi:MAG TPA: GerMN domain-containing protein [Vicinamibacterales bacterium]|nr:GerMN domain-containing protein [Vicinamibacterales bacterium]
MNERGGNVGRLALGGVVLVAAIALGWLLFVRLPARSNNARAAAKPNAPAASASTSDAPEGRKIKAHLFYVAESGTRLTSLEQDVPFGDNPVDQAKAIITAQIAPPTAPAVSAIPAGTSLRALFITARGEAYVDLSPEFRAAHPGGSMNEILTVYTIVNALTSNLPAVEAVQVLVDGKEIDTLAGHVDLRRPLMKNMAWVE